MIEKPSASKWSKPLTTIPPLYVGFFLLCACISTVQVCAQLRPPRDAALVIPFEHFTPKEGLASDKVISVVQDPQGFLWIGTQEGLNRYDGYELIHYRHDPMDSSSLSDNTAEAVYVDRFGLLWVGTWNGLNRYDPITNSFKSYFHDSSDPSSLSHNHIHSLLEDESGRLWIATRDGGLCRYDRDRDAFVRYLHDPAKPGSLSYNVVTVLYVDRQGTLWVGTGFPWDHQSNRGGLNRYDPGNDTFVRYEHIPGDPTSLHYNEISALYEDTDGTFWVATWGDGLQAMNRAKGTFSSGGASAGNGHALWPHLRKPNGPSGAIRFFHEDSQGIRWIGGFLGGLDRYDPATQVMTHYSYEPSQLQGLSDNAVWSIFEDRQHILWISTWKGLNKISPPPYHFQLISPDPTRAGSLQDGHTEEILADRQGILWAGTWAGLERIDPETGKTALFEVGKGLSNKEVSEMVLTLSEDSTGDIWVGTLHYGLARFNRTTESFTMFGYDPVSTSNMSRNVVNAILEDHNGTLLVGGNQGVFRFDRMLQGFISLYDKATTPPEKLNTFALALGENGRIWLGSASGLEQFDPSTGAVTSFLEGYAVSTILYDGTQGLWLGTFEKGLLHFDPATRTYTSFTTADGMPDNTVRGLIRDASGKLWISTRHGLAWFDPNIRAIRTFTSAKAPPIYEFYPQAVTACANGDLLFGGNGGILRFDPKAVEDDSILAVPVITRLLLFNKPIGTHKAGPATSSIPGNESITLAYNQNDLTFEYAGLHFIRPAENTYRYHLDNYEEEWRYVGGQRSAIYPNLPPGDYVFQVQAANPDGVWSTEAAMINVLILPPWWKTKWALISSGFLFLLGVFAVDRFQRTRLIRAERERAHLREMQLRAEIAEAQTHHLKVLEEVKTQFYTNITHEFRTPLTVIMGMIDNIHGHENERKLIRRNSKNLLRLINQLLDLSKLDSGLMKMDLVQSDIINYLQYLTESFHSMAHEKKVHLTFYAETPELVMDFDEVKIQHVVYNLLSNALKFTKEGGKVVLHANQSERNGQLFLKLKVQDTGVGIPEGQLAYIFNRFYQADNSSTRKGEGTGIGLALTNELVELMGGSISVKSELGKGTTFTLLVPVRLEAGTQQSLSEFHTSTYIGPELVPDIPDVITSPANQGATSPAREKPILLLIEDNTDVTIYIVGLLERDYEVHTAPNGLVGIESAFEIIPDIIISDVMMPEKDGYEVCEILKNDERTSHIPIILLTAKAEISDRITGLSKGADAYLMKPFIKEELYIRLEKLLELRKAFQRRYAGVSGGVASNREVAEPTLEDTFLQKLQKTVLENLDEAELGAEQLSRAVLLSPSQLYRKLAALTGEPPNAFIRKIRLHRAMEMLKTTDLNISEIAYAVGFNDPNYFSRAFSKEFGKAPIEHRK